jgi:hypothetical protein
MINTYIVTIEVMIMLKENSNSEASGKLKDIKAEP